MLSRSTSSALRGVLGLGGLLLLAALTQADDFWKTKPPSDWTAKEALKLLQRSPWAHEKVVTHPPYRQEVEIRSTTTIWSEGERPAPRPSGPAVESDYIVRYLVRWESAVPVTQAFGRLEELGEQEAAEAMGPASYLPDDRYVVTVLMTFPPRGGPVGYDNRDLFDDLSNDELRSRAWLETQQAKVLPLEVERTWIGPIAALHFFFPRTQNGQPLFRTQGRAERAEFGVKGKMFNLTTKFTLELHSLR